MIRARAPGCAFFLSLFSLAACGEPFTLAPATSSASGASGGSLGGAKSGSETVASVGAGGEAGAGGVTGGTGGGVLDAGNGDALAVSMCHVAPVACATVDDCASPCAASCGLPALLCDANDGACYCGTPEDAGPCAHGLCETGAPIDPACSPCAAAVCATSLTCCTKVWGAFCVETAVAVCGESCPGAG